MTPGQPELFHLEPQKPSCEQCGAEAVVARYGVVVCTVCKHGWEQARAAEDAAKRASATRQKHIVKARRRRR